MNQPSKHKSSRKGARDQSQSPSDARDVNRLLSFNRLLLQSFADLEELSSPASPQVQFPLSEAPSTTNQVTQASASVDPLTMTRCIVVCYPGLATGRLVMEAIYAELTCPGRNPRGAVRFLREWVALRYEDDFRRSKSLRRKLFEVALMRPAALSASSKSDLATELNSLKLQLIAIGARRRSAPPRAPGLRKKSEALPKAESKERAPRATVLLSVTGTGKPPLALVTPHPHVSTDPKPLPRALNVSEFMKLDSRLVARHLNALSFETICMVRLADFSSDGPSVATYVDRFNRVTNWVASTILVQKTPKAMRSVVIKFLEVVKFSSDLYDFPSCFAIMASFDLREVDRLRRLWHIPPNIKAMAAECSRLVNSARNYGNYRAALRARMDAGKPCVLHLGVTSRDFKLSDEGNKAFDAAGNVNRAKLVVEGQALSDIARCQAVPPEGYSKFLEKRHDGLYRLLLELPGKTQAELERLSDAHRSRAASAQEDTAASAADDSGSSMGSYHDPSSHASSKGDEASNHSEDFVDL